MGSPPNPTEADRAMLSSADQALEHYNTTTPRGTYTLNLLGDIMLGRLIDQLFTTHVHNPNEASHISALRSQYTAPHLQALAYTALTPWGTTLPLLYAADLTLGNLETSATTHDKPWPDKVFNYRMHPANISAFKVARMDYVSLANNHTLDFSEHGLRDTVDTVRDSGIRYAGAGLSRHEAVAPAVLRVGRRRRRVLEEDREEPRQGAADEGKRGGGGIGKGEHDIHVYAASDHPSDWASVPSFHLIDYTTRTRKRLKRTLTSLPSPSLKIFSVHWGSNYQWQPEKERQSLAHFLIDECGVDIVHGHSSHHVQGVEVYKGALIVYGCGDFVDDYAVTPGYRNDLTAVWRVRVREVGIGGAVGGGEEGGRKKLKVERLEVYPTIIDRFRARLLEREERDHEWVVDKVRELSRDLRTEAESQVGDVGQLVFKIRPPEVS